MFLLEWKSVVFWGHGKSMLLVCAQTLRFFKIYSQKNEIFSNQKSKNDLI